VITVLTEGYCLVSEVPFSGRVVVKMSDPSETSSKPSVPKQIGELSLLNVRCMCCVCCVPPPKKEVMFSLCWFVCLSVCLSARLLKKCGRIFMNFVGRCLCEWCR